MKLRAEKERVHGRVLERALPAFRAPFVRWLVVPGVTTAVFYVLGYAISRFAFSVPIGLRGAARDLVLLTVVSVCCFALSRRIVPFVLLQALLISVLLIGNALKIAFYGGPIMPDDVHSLPALLMILDGWQFLLTVAALVTPVLLLVGNLRMKPCALACGLGGLAVLSAPILLASGLTVTLLDRWVGNIPWNQRANYLIRGAVLYLVQETARSMAERDPVPAADEVFAAMRSFEPRLRPIAASSQGTRRNVHVVVLESFWDASQLEGAHLSRDPLDESFRALWRAADYSTALVPVFGGHTANTEFEILCGYPVVRDSVKFDRQLTNTVPCLPAVLNRLGYRTVASHPNVPAFWNRNNAYPRIGFETFHSSRDFVPDDLNGKLLSDESLYRQVRARMEETATRPSFSYVLTYFGHWPYPLNEKRPEIISSSSAVTEVPRYANTVYYKSREAMEHVAAILRSDPEALIVLVSDHLPFLGSNFAGYAESGVLAGTLGSFDETMLRTYVSTPLLVIDGSRGPLKVGAIPAYRLPSLILELLGFDVPTIWDFTRQPEGLRIRPLPGLTLVLDEADEAFVCQPGEEIATVPCQTAALWLQSTRVLDADIFIGSGYALRGLH